jgi:hypothetical protein
MTILDTFKSRIQAATPPVTPAKKTKGSKTAKKGEGIKEGKSKRQ